MTPTSIAKTPVAVFGLGKLGLPLAALLASRGQRVVGVDPNEHTRAAAAGAGPLWTEPGLADLLARHRDRMTTTDDPALAVADTAMAMIIVPTPSDETGAFSNDAVLGVMQRIGAALRGSTRTYDVVVVSTVMPGSTGGPIRECLARSSRRQVGGTLGLVYSPLFVALGSVIRDLRTPDVVLVGEDPEHADAGSRLVQVLSSVLDPSPRRAIHRLPWAGAELAKIAINSFITTKIAFANWVARIAEAHAVPPEQVLAAIGADSRIGAKYFSWGMPFGGPCFPRDNRAMARVAERWGLPGSLPHATDELNESHLGSVYESVAACASGRKVAVLGLAYKDGTAVTEESAGLRVATWLEQHGHEVVVHDPLVTQNALTQAPTVRAAVAGAAVVVVATRAYETIDVDPETIVVNPWRVPITRSGRTE